MRRALPAALLVLVAGCGEEPVPSAVKAPRDGAVVWAIGDGADGSRDARRVAGLIAADRPDRVLYLGDVYETGTARDFRERFATVYGGLKRRMEPTPGNHDWPNHETGYDPFWRKPPRYAFTIGGWRVISLNSETPRDAAQLRFLRRQLRGRDTCVIAFMHRPRFNAGEHRAEQLDVEPLWRGLRGEATLLLSGHDHNLQRFRPVDGVTQLVIGAGGHERYNVHEDDRRLAFSEDRDDGALRMLLRPGSADLRIVRSDGEQIDRSTVAC